jgi:hypothetical protein
MEFSPSLASASSIGHVKQMPSVHTAMTAIWPASEWTKAPAVSARVRVVNPTRSALK